MIQLGTRKRKGKKGKIEGLKGLQKEKPAAGPLYLYTYISY